MALAGTTGENAMCMGKLEIVRTCGASGRVLEAGSTVDVVENVTALKQVSLRDAVALVRLQKAKWVETVEPKVDDSPAERTRPDVTARAAKTPKKRKRGRSKAKKDDE